MKRKAKLLLLVLNVLFWGMSCTNRYNIEWLPFKYVDIKKRKSLVTGEDNLIILYACGISPNIDSLKLFCSVIKGLHTNEQQIQVVFFDSAKFAKFPKTEIVADYSHNDDAEALKHLKAIYGFSKFYNFNRLNYFEKNGWDQRSPTPFSYTIE